MTTELRGAVAIITGAGTGIGAATARDLAKAGARVVLTGRRGALLDEQVAAITGEGGEAWAVAADVREFDQVEAIVARTVERYGRLDIFVANAAVADYGPIDSADPSLWADVITTNVLGVLYSVRAALPQMKTQGSGHIVIVSSASGRVTYVGEPAYIASKHATVAFADCLRQEVAPLGIRVVIVEPGDFRTGFTAARRLARGAGAGPEGPADITRDRATGPGVGRVFRPADGQGSSPYATRQAKALAVMEHDEQHGAAPDAVARLVHRVITARSPGVRYAVGPVSEKLALILQRLLPSRLFMWGIGKYYRVR
jgi:NAD(P)-dependent dehydrogenase (short-subunit alcohol dehydrogenase family)